VLEDLSLGDGTVFFDASGMSEAGAPDGLTLDRAGNLYATGPGGVLVFDSEGRHLGTIMAEEIPANAGWGDDGRTLYMTARTGLYRIRLSAEGLVFR
jgi:gluconolactonase